MVSSCFLNAAATISTLHSADTVAEEQEGERKQKPWEGERKDSRRGSLLRAGRRFSQTRQTSFIFL